MPQIPFRVPQIQSLMPSVDARTQDQTFVLDGRNFRFDSKGPKSGFACKQLTPFPFPDARDVQGKRVQGRTFVFTQDSILSWRESVPFTWDLCYAFTTQTPTLKRTPWSAIYINGYYCFAQEYHGFFKAAASDTSQRLWIHKYSDADIPGLISGILAMDVVHGRAILVNKTTIQWGALADVTDFTPTLGGAGFQVINNFVKGTFLALTSFQDGFVVWTTEGAVLAEFVGGDNVWRFSAYTSQERPYSAWATSNLVNGGSVFLSRRGLKITNATTTPQDWTPDFNEFLRDYLDDKAENLRKWRLEYDSSVELIYLSESTNLDTYWRTFVLSPTLNKWGIFSDSVYGFLPLSQEVFGYVGLDGIPNYFTPTAINRDTEPDNALGLSRIYPRLEKQHNVLSSSATSRAIMLDVDNTMTPQDVSQAGWYIPSVLDTVQPNGIKGLDSWVEIGYLRPPELTSTADAEGEIQQIVIGSWPSAAPTQAGFYTDWKDDWFYATVDDMNSPATITLTDVLEDWNASTGDEDWSAFSDQTEDWNSISTPSVTFTDESTIDLMALDSTDDVAGVTLGIPEVTYGISVKSSTDGITFASVVPELAKFDTAMRTWNLSANGSFHRLRLEATNPWEAFWVQYLGCTIAYSGRIT